MTHIEAIQIVSEAVNAISDYRSIFIGESERGWDAFLAELVVELKFYAESGDLYTPTTHEGWVSLVESWALAKVNCW